MKKVILINILVFLLGSVCFSQDEKIEPRVDMTYYKTSDDIPYLKVRVRKRPDRRYYPMEGVAVMTFFNKQSEEMKIGQVITNDKGEGTVELPGDLMGLWNSLDEFEFIAFIDETDSTEEASESLIITKARISLSSEEDSTITAKIERKTEEGWIPEEDVQVKFFVKRDFGRLPVSEEYLATDSTGIIKVKYDPEKEIPANKEGRLVIGGFVEDHDEFGNLFHYMTTNWGTVTIDDNTAFEKRSLWAPRNNVPLWLLITANFIIASVWLVVIYLIMQIFKIKKLSNVN